MADFTNICVYQHIRLDTNQIFYIGIGKIERAYSKHGRSKFWNKISNKTEYKIEILHENLLWELACKIERYLISFYGRRDLNRGNLCNLTDGGEGTLSTIISEETRNKLKIAGKSEKNILKLKKINTNKIGIKRTQETINKISNTHKNRIFSEEHKKKISQNRCKLVLCTLTGIYYNSVKEASKIYNLNQATLTHWLNGRLTNKSSLIYV